MFRFQILVLVASFGLSGCAGDGDTQDAGVDGAGDDGGVVECSTSDNDCTAGLECLCCGSIGPAPICLCTTGCDSDPECTHPGHGTCNKPDPGSSGICTPADYNCCWFCQ
jgi:hypothetical protein